MGELSRTPSFANAIFCISCLLLCFFSGAEAILARSPLAATTFDDNNGAHIRVYYQEVNGTLKETFFDSGSWATRPGFDTPGSAKLNTGLGATSWDQGTQVLYSLYFFTSSISYIIM
jgi:hypothetical protein